VIGTANPPVAPERRRPLLPPGIHACLFDLDGVLTDTASVHAVAWKQTFDAFLRKRSSRDGTPFAPFELRDYAEYVDGRQRFDGVRSFLRSRRIGLPEGSFDDPPEADTVGGIGNRKNRLVLAMIERDGVRAFPGSVRFVRAVRDRGLPCAVVSASANCREVLEGAGLEELFDAQVDGVVAQLEHLKGKPAPDTFLAAARRLGVPPGHAAVFEDALAGVEAARSGAFAFVVGVDRHERGDALRAHGADTVVRDLSELLTPA
jgi:beta-phosphoglucomutase family hydrolase